MPDPVSAIAPQGPAQADPNSPTTPQPQENKVDAERFAQLARREKAIRTEAKRLAEQKAQIEKDAQARSGHLPADQWKQKFLQDPTALGFTPEELSNITLAQLNQDPQSQLITKLQQQIDELRQGQQKTLDAVTEREKKAYDEAIKNISREVSVLVDADSAYEMVKATGSQEAVVQLIRETYDSSGVILSVAEASQKVEEYLLGEAIKLAGHSKVQSKLAPPPPAPEAQPQAPAQKQITLRQSPTLTHAGTPPASASFTAKDRRARAIAAFSGQLK